MNKYKEAIYKEFRRYMDTIKIHQDKGDKIFEQLACVDWMMRLADSDDKKRSNLDDLRKIINNSLNKNLEIRHNLMYQYRQSMKKIKMNLINKTDYTKWFKSNFPEYE